MVCENKACLYLSRQKDVSEATVHQTRTARAKNKRKKPQPWYSDLESYLESRRKPAVFISITRAFPLDIFTLYFFSFARFPSLSLFYLVFLFLERHSLFSFAHIGERTIALSGLGLALVNFFHSFSNQPVHVYLVIVMLH